MKTFDPRLGVCALLFSLLGSPLATFLPAQAACTSSISPAYRNVQYPPATGSFTLTAPADCAWTVENTNDWVTILSPTNGSGSAMINYSVSSNTTIFARTANIRVGNHLFALHQYVAPGNFAEAIDIVGAPLRLWSIGLPGWTGQTNVTHDGVDSALSSGGSFTLVATGAGTLTFWWKLSSPTNSNLRLYVNGSEQFRINAETDWEQRTLNLPSGIQSLEWYFEKRTGGNTELAWVDQVQFVPIGNTNPPSCNIAVFPSSRAHGHGTATNQLNVITQNGCTWGVWNTNSWITILYGANGSGNATVGYSLAANTNRQPRAGNVIFGGRSFGVTQSGVPYVELIGRTETNALVSVKGDQAKMYVVEYSEDLIHWIPISTNAPASTVTDEVNNTARGFYRTVELP